MRTTFATEHLGEFPSGQRGQTVNLLRFASMVRIRPPPPEKVQHLSVLDFFCVWVFGGWIRKAGPSKQSSGLFARPWLFRKKRIRHLYPHSCDIRCFVLCRGKDSKIKCKTPVESCLPSARWRQLLNFCHRQKCKRIRPPFSLFANFS